MSGGKKILTWGEDKFAFHVQALEFVQVENPMNRVSVFEMEDFMGNGYRFQYDPTTKSVALPWDSPDDLLTITIPELKELDAAGMAQRYGIPVGRVRSMSDFEIMVDQEAFARRVLGELPLIKTPDFTYTVDSEHQCFRTDGPGPISKITFLELEECGAETRIGADAVYYFALDRISGDLCEFDFETMTRYPDNAIMVEFPTREAADRIGHNRFWGYPDTYGLKQHNVTLVHTAKVIPWAETGLGLRIKENLKKINNPENIVGKDMGKLRGKRR